MRAEGLAEQLRHVSDRLVLGVFVASVRRGNDVTEKKVHVYFQVIVLIKYNSTKAQGVLL